MGCNFSVVGGCISNNTYTLERLTLICAMCWVMTCILFSLTMLVSVGMGIGYFYCYVDYSSTKYVIATTTTTTPRRWSLWHLLFNVDLGTFIEFKRRRSARFTIQRQNDSNYVINLIRFLNMANRTYRVDVKYFNKDPSSNSSSMSLGASPFMANASDNIFFPSMSNVFVKNESAPAWAA
ncbi:unnamed protein product [Plutella xylostella]|uniref:(diamondback moth) hypothetical protein n=1 Tax=Plutella xylostella TaxID=51655 RepID=A0A8S4DL41_PLUXY|nr:uncharacterized protein LOC105383849 [Plutella xylostella]CAG9101015.1 unnamed protein product [Plutella xylostella]